MSAWEGDLLERAEVAEFLQNLLEKNNEDIKVVNIDSPWGTGKTFFLERWSRHLREERGVVYFNAWEKDYTGDPFVSLVSAIRDQLKEQRSLPDDIENTIKEFTTKATKAIVSTTPGLAKVLSKGLLKKLIDVEGEELAAAIHSVTDELADKAVEALIVNSEKDQEAVKQFREIFEKLVKEVAAEKSTEDGDFPVYVFIDELDRCRPTYAIELLERIKHFFDVPGCVFIIATDTKQLCHSIRAVYGNGFDSFEYLKRFFDVTYSLDNSGIEKWVSTNFNLSLNLFYYGLRLARKYNKGGSSSSWSFAGQVEPDERTVITEDDEFNELQIIFLSLAKTFKTSLRDLLKIKRRLLASLYSINSNKIHFFLLCYLVFLKNSDGELYELLYRRELNDFESGADNKFPPFKLYFITESVSVHAVAIDYIKNCVKSKEELRRRIHDKSNKLPYQSEILSDAINGQDYMKYFKLVDLAIQIK